MIVTADRSYRGKRDLERAIDLLVTSRAQASKDRAPTAKRLAPLTRSRLWEPAQDAHVWEESAKGASHPSSVMLGILLAGEGVWREGSS
jgi:hypothetical protein